MSTLLHLAHALLLAHPTTSMQEAAAAPARERLVAILVYPDVELLDFAGPGEVFSAADGPAGHAFRVVTVAKTKAPIESQGFVAITPEYSIADCPAPDIVVVPGGHVPHGDAELQQWVKRCAQSSELVLSVCNGALLLASSGLLDGLEATTHHGSLEALASAHPRTRVLTNRRFVDNGRIMTCAGVSAGIDGALHVVERLLGDEVARNTARYMEYDWRPAEIAALHAQPGRPVEESSARKLARIAASQGPAAALAAYRALPTPPEERELAAGGRLLLRTGRKAEARALLELLVAVHPESASAHDSLSEAAALLGDTATAVRHAEEALAKLESQPEADEARAKQLHNVAASRLVRLGQGDARTLRYACTCGGECDALRYVEAGPCPGCGMPLSPVQAKD